MSALNSFDVLAVGQRLPLDEMRDTLAELQAIRATIDEQINAIRGVLDAVTGSQGYPRKRDAVLGLLQERAGTEMPLSQIRAHLIARGEIPDTPKAAHALQMMVSTLVREGLLERVRQGVYRLDKPGGGDRLRAAIAPYRGGVFSASDGDRSATETSLHRKEDEP